MFNSFLCVICFVMYLKNGYNGFNGDSSPFSLRFLLSNRIFFRIGAKVQSNSEAEQFKVLHVKC